MYIYFLVMMPTCHQRWRYTVSDDKVGILATDGLYVSLRVRVLRVKVFTDIPGPSLRGSLLDVYGHFTSLHCHWCSLINTYIEANCHVARQYYPLAEEKSIVHKEHNYDICNWLAPRRCGCWCSFYYQSHTNDRCLVQFLWMSSYLVDD